jgi:hypothetical protein
MSNKKTTTETTTSANLNALLNNALFVQMSRINEIANLQKDIETDENLNFERTLRISEHFKIALSFFSTDEAKYMSKECNTKLTNETLATIFKYSLAQFNRYKAVSKLDFETIKKYKEETPKNRGLDGLIKFANAKNTENLADTNEESESESEIKVKEESLQIKVGKDNKISIKGKASKEVITLLIEELKKMMA